MGIYLVKNHYYLNGLRANRLRQMEPDIISYEGYNLMKLQWNRYLADDSDCEEVYLDERGFNQPKPFCRPKKK